MHAAAAKLNTDFRLQNLEHSELSLTVQSLSNDSSSRLTRSILIIDPDREFCARVANSLGTPECKVHALHRGQADVINVLKESWCAVIVGSAQSEQSGLAILKTIRQHSDVPILVVASGEDEDNEVAALQAGADNFLPKSTSIRKFRAYLDAIIRRGKPNRRDSKCAFLKHFAFGGLYIDLEAQAVVFKGQILVLTPSERAILIHLAKFKGKVMIRSNLYAGIRGGEYGPLDRSLDVMVSTLRQKIGDDPRRPRFIRTIRSEGYMLVDPDTK